MEQDNQDLFENIWQNRDHRRRYQDQDDFESEDNFYKNFESSMPFNKQSLFENDFDRTTFGKWDREDREDKYDQEFNGEQKYDVEGRRHHLVNKYEQDQQQDSEEQDYDSDNSQSLYGRQHNKYNKNNKYEQGLQSDIDSEEEMTVFGQNKYNNKYDTEYKHQQQYRSEDDDDEEQEFNRNYSNVDEEEYENTNTDDVEEYQQDKYGKQHLGQTKRCTVLKHKIVERQGKTCFSVRPRVQCNKHISEQCQPIQHQTKTVKFYCAQTPLEARYLEAKVQRQQVVQQLLQKPVHFTEQLELPTQCTVSGRSF
jgi:hypothetical protein